jgi:hypothetical protein
VLVEQSAGIVARAVPPRHPSANPRSGEGVAGTHRSRRLTGRARRDADAGVHRLGSLRSPKVPGERAPRY